MFSCCRANPKNAANVKKGKKRLVIPTITIENGKSHDNIESPVAMEKHSVGCEIEDPQLEAAAIVEPHPVNHDNQSSPTQSLKSADSTTTTASPTLQQQSNKTSTTSHDHSQGLPPTKSCLSRHNSTHTSIKKRVNISTFAEIIEPYPLPLPSIGGDDDDVFSDSLPPPKRESMCAPYIQRDNTVPESAAFAHGLPDWFNDERINDACQEPPVTPVGRDELEMKRQRLYSDLLRAAHAAVDHSVRFKPFEFAMESPKAGDCDVFSIKPSVAENFEHLVNRLETLVKRLEHSVSSREHTTEQPSVPDRVKAQTENPIISEQSQSSSCSDSITPQKCQHSQQVQRPQQHENPTEGSLQNQNISKVLDSYQGASPLITEYEQTEEKNGKIKESLSLLPLPPTMSVLAYQDIVSGPLSQFLALSAKIGGDVAKQAQIVKLAFDAQLQYVTLATQCAQPSQDRQMDLLKPTSTHISAIQDFREKNRASPFFNHLSAISESIPALGWVCVAPTPGPHVKEMNDAGQFYTNRVLKEWKDKNVSHVEWARAWIQTLSELQAYIKQYHTTGLVWSGKGGAAAPPPPPPIGSCPPPPPPPAFDLSAMSLEGDERSALFAEINQGENITRNLKKVTSDMQTHKNTALRTGPAPFKTPAQYGAAVAAPLSIAPKEPVFTRDGKKWLIEHQKNNRTLLVENAEMNNVVYIFKCEGSTITVKGKVNNIVLDSCKKCSLLFDSVVASIEFVNCQSVQMQVLGFVPTVIIDKTDGCQMYLSKASLGVEIVNSKSSEMNVMLPEGNGDYNELALPEQYKTTISGKTLKTVCIDSLG